MKNRLIFLGIAGIIALTGCSDGKDKQIDPTIALINAINKNEKQDLETTVQVMKSFYKNALMNVNSKDCAVQTIDDKDELGKAMILLSQKYCGKSGLFDNEMQVILNNINVKKQLNIAMNKIDNTQEYLDLDFDLPTATKMKRYGISPQEADKIFAFIERNPRFSDEDYFYGMLESGVTTAAEFIDWTKAPLPSYKILQVVQLGVNLDEYKEWFKMHYSTPNQIKAFKEAGIKTPAEAREWYEVAKKLNDHNLASYDTIIAWKKLGIDKPETVAELRKVSIYSPRDFTKWNKAGVKSADEILELSKMGIDVYDLEKWTKAGANDITDIKKWLDAGFPNDGVEYLVDLKKVDFSINDWERWSEAGATRPRDIYEWRSMGFDADQFKTNTAPYEVLGTIEPKLKPIP